MNKLLITLLPVVCCLTALSQKSEKVDYKWKKPGAFAEIPEQFKNEDAIAIYNETGIYNDFDVSSMIRYSTVHFIKRRLRILTASGLKEYSNISIRRRGNTKVLALDARTIKKNGQIIIAKPEDVKVLKTYDKDKDIYYYEYRIAIPGTEVGDEIEYIYTNSYDGLTFADDIYLHNEIPCIKSSFQLSLALGLETEIYSINGMKEPEKTTNETTEILKWTMENVPAVKNQNYSIWGKELPYVQFKLNRIVLEKYNIERSVAIKSWGDLYSDLARDVYDRNVKSRGLDDYFSSYKTRIDTMKVLNKVKFFTDKINNEFKILSDIDEENKYKPIKYFLDLKTIDESNLLLFYKYLFYYLKIPYETCFGKSRYEDDLLPEIISSHQITHVFYSFSDEGSRHFLFISSADKKFNIDEQPFSLEETKIIMLKKDNPFNDDEPTVHFSKMNRLPQGTNIRSANCSYAVSADSDFVSCDTKIFYSGMPSSLYRTNWKKELEGNKKEDLLEHFDETENKNFVLDTVFIENSESVFPFKFNLRVKSKERNIISPSGENIASLRIHIPWDHLKIPTYTYTRITDMYIPYMYNDEINVFVQLPFNAGIINENDFKKSITNEAGSFTLSISKISDSQYKISSVYKINCPMLPKDKYQKLNELNELVDQTKDLSLLYKKL